MVKSKVGSRPNEAKYEMALYGAAWPEGDYYYICGGGGHGLVNRIVWARYQDGKCTPQLGEYKLGKDTPMRMLMCPWGSSLLVGNAAGGVRRLQIGADNHMPKLIEVSAAFQEVLHGLSNEVSTMKFNSRGNLLAVGFREHGTLKIVSYPSMRECISIKLADPEVKDLDFCPHETAAKLLKQRQHQQPEQQQGSELLATVGGDGVCQIWELQSDRQQLIVKLETPAKGLVKPRFVRCCWARNGQPLLYVFINSGPIRGRTPKDRKDPSYLAAYGPSPEGLEKGWVLLKKVHVSDMPASAMDISKHGEWIAAGFADGMLRVFNPDTLTQKAEAEASIAFVSGVTFNGDNNAVIAVGGDANCYVMELVSRRQSSSGMLAWLKVLLFLLLCGVAAALLHFYQQPEALPLTALQYIQQWQQQPQIEHACRTGSFPLHDQACGWLHRVSQILADAELFAEEAKRHDEL